jgi:hypothetical protein
MLDHKAAKGAQLTFRKAAVSVTLQRFSLSPLLLWFLVYGA